MARLGVSRVFTAIKGAKKFTSVRNDKYHINSSDKHFCLEVRAPVSPSVQALLSGKLLFGICRIFSKEKREKMTIRIDSMDAREPYI